MCGKSIDAELPQALKTYVAHKITTLYDAMPTKCRSFQQRNKAKTNCVQPEAVNLDGNTLCSLYIQIYAYV